MDEKIAKNITATIMHEIYREYVNSHEPDLAELINMETARQLVSGMESLKSANLDTALALGKVVAEFKDVAQSESLFSNFIQVLFHAYNMIIEGYINGQYGR